MLEQATQRAAFSVGRLTCRECGQPGEVIKRLADYTYFPSVQLANLRVRCTGCAREGRAHVCGICGGKTRRGRGGLTSSHDLCTRCGRDHHAAWD